MLKYKFKNNEISKSRETTAEFSKGARMMNKDKHRNDSITENSTLVTDVIK